MGNSKHLYMKSEHKLGLKDVFFFYLEEKPGALLFRQILSSNEQGNLAKWDAIDEILRINILQSTNNNEPASPHHNIIQYEWLTRLAKINFPKGLTTRNDLGDYYNYLNFYAKPTINQLESAYKKLEISCKKFLGYKEPFPNNMNASFENIYFENIYYLSKMKE
jgi:hypothetical protein